MRKYRTPWRPCFSAPTKRRDAAGDDDLGEQTVRVGVRRGLEIAISAPDTIRILVAQHNSVGVVRSARRTMAIHNVAEHVPSRVHASNTWIPAVAEKKNK